MERIAKRAILSKGGLYHHFLSKTDILFAANLKFMEPIENIMLEINKSTSVREGLKQFISGYLSCWNSHRRELSLYFFTMNISVCNHQIMGYYQTFTNDLSNFFKGQFIKLQEQRREKKRNAHSHAVALISCLDGYLAYMLIDPLLSIDKTTIEIQSTLIDDFCR